MVGDYGRWQLKVVLLLWIPMFFCGTQFVTTDFMNMEPKVLLCQDTVTCTSYRPRVFPSNLRSALKKKIFLHDGYQLIDKCLVFAISNFQWIMEGGDD